MIWQVSPGPDLFCRTVVALTRGITDRGAGARYTRILPQLHGARATPSREQFWLHPRSGPRVHRTRSAGLSRVHRTCPIYFLGPSSFRRCAFEALKRAKNLCSVRGPCEISAVCAPEMPPPVSNLANNQYFICACSDLGQQLPALEAWYLMVTGAGCVWPEFDSRAGVSRLQPYPRLAHASYSLRKATTPKKPGSART